jgi:heterodisulfide reductase subunit A2
MTNEPLPPRTGVYLCDCGGQISKAIDLQALFQAGSGDPGVAHARVEPFPCSKDGQERIRQDISQGIERILIAGCAPRLVEKLFRENAAQQGWTPATCILPISASSAPLPMPGSP